MSVCLSFIFLHSAFYHSFTFSHHFTTFSGGPCDTKISYTLAYGGYQNTTILHLQRQSEFFALGNQVSDPKNKRQNVHKETFLYNRKPFDKGIFDIFGGASGLGSPHTNCITCY